MAVVSRGSARQDGVSAFFVKPLQRFSASLVGATAAQLLTLLNEVSEPEAPVARTSCVMGVVRTRPNVAKRKVLEQLARALIRPA